MYTRIRLHIIYPTLCIIPMKTLLPVAHLLYIIYMWLWNGMDAVLLDGVLDIIESNENPSGLWSNYSSPYKSKGKRIPTFTVQLPCIYAIEERLILITQRWQLFFLKKWWRTDGQGKKVWTLLTSLKSGNMYVCRMRKGDQKASIRLVQWQRLSSLNMLRFHEEMGLDCFLLLVKWEVGKQLYCFIPMCYPRTHWDSRKQTKHQSLTFVCLNCLQPNMEMNRRFWEDDNTAAETVADDFKASVTDALIKKYATNQQLLRRRHSYGGNTLKHSPNTLICPIYTHIHKLLSLLYLNSNLHLSCLYNPPNTLIYPIYTTHKHP